MDEETKTLKKYLRKLKRHIRELRFEEIVRPGYLETPRGPLRVIDIQKRLAETQSSLQAEISRLKSIPHRDAQQHQLLRDLRVIRWHCRRVGDGFAWEIFAHDRGRLHGLSQGPSVPTSPKEDDGARGVFAAAEMLLSSGAGIPVIHDITDCLRIGDLSYLEMGSGAIHTLEVKTSRLAEERIDDTQSRIELGVRLYSARPWNPSVGDDSSEPPQMEPANPPVFDTNQREDRRLGRQLKRMDIAATRSEASLNKLHVIDGEPVFYSQAEEGKSLHHWAELRRAIREARRKGSSFFSLDDFVAYALFYSPDGVSQPDIGSLKFKEKVDQTIFNSSRAERDTVTVDWIPCDEDTLNVSEIMPFTLYKIPMRAKLELVENKLIIFSMVNYARYEERAIELGFRVVTDESSKDVRSFHLEFDAQVSEDSSAMVEFHAPWPDIVRAVHEFTGLQGAMRSALGAMNLPRHVKPQDFTEAFKSVSEEYLERTRSRALRNGPVSGSSRHRAENSNPRTPKTRR